MDKCELGWVVFHETVKAQENGRHWLCVLIEESTIKINNCSWLCAVPSDWNVDIHLQDNTLLLRRYVVSTLSFTLHSFSSWQIKTKYLSVFRLWCWLPFRYGDFTLNASSVVIVAVLDVAAILKLHCYNTRHVRCSSRLRIVRGSKMAIELKFFTWCEFTRLFLCCGKSQRE